MPPKWATEGSSSTRRELETFGQAMGGVGRPAPNAGSATPAPLRRTAGPATDSSPANKPPTTAHLTPQPRTLAETDPGEVRQTHARRLTQAPLDQMGTRRAGQLRHSSRPVHTP